MIFASDNTGPAHPQILQAVTDANAGYALPYGNDPVTQAARAAVRHVFEAPDAVVEFVTTGSAANALALATLANPYDGIFCHTRAHVEEDECGAPEFYSAAKLILIEGENGKIDPDNLERAIRICADRGVHGVQAGPVSLTSITEMGTAYSLEELRAIIAVAKAHDLPVHLDGARFANACAALGCTAAEMSWKLGIDAVSFGGTKNGCLGVEAVVIFDPAKGRELELRRKRGGHLLSKQRYLSAQMGAYAKDDLWLTTARMANARMAGLIQGLARVPGARAAFPPAGNLAFIDLPAAGHRRAFAAGAVYALHPSNALDQAADDDLLRCRVVCDWSQTEAAVDRLLAAWAG